MKKYSKYKDSGVEWIGEIPNGWKVSRLGHYMQIKRGAGYQYIEKVEGAEFEEILRISDFTKLNPLKAKPIKEFDKYRVKENDILIAGTGASAGQTILVNNRMDNMAHSYNALRIFSSKVYTPYIYYQLNSDSIEEQMNLAFTGSAQPFLDVGRIAGLVLAIPTIKEQKSIANYLDQKTTIIDTLLEKTKQKITTLQEQRTAIINQAVTKGLTHLQPAKGGTKGVPLKDSGVEWIGEIPRSWDITRARYIGKTQNGISAGSDYFGSGFPFVSYSDVYKNATIPRQVKGLAQSPEKDRIAFSVKENDIFFTRTSETIEEIGMASTCIETLNDAVFAGFLIRFRPDSSLIYKGFSKYYFRCFIPRVFFVKEMNLVTRASLSQELLKRLPVLLPGIEEQKVIGKYLDQKTAQFDTLIQKEQQRINLLKEYRQSLISEVVTGKICVHNEIPVT